jgi:hypothetical protein
MLEITRVVMINRVAFVVREANRVHRCNWPAIALMERHSKPTVNAFKIVLFRRQIFRLLLMLLLLRRANVISNRHLHRIRLHRRRLHRRLRRRLPLPLRLHLLLRRRPHPRLHLNWASYRRSSL